MSFYCTLSHKCTTDHVKWFSCSTKTCLAWIQFLINKDASFLSNISLTFASMQLNSTFFEIFQDSLWRIPWLIRLIEWCHFRRTPLYKATLYKQLSNRFHVPVFKMLLKCQLFDSTVHWFAVHGSKKRPHHLLIDFCVVNNVFTTSSPPLVETFKFRGHQTFLSGNEISFLKIFFSWD